MKKLFVMLLIAIFATTGVALAKKEVNTTSTKTKTETSTQMKSTKEMPKGISTASMEGQGKKVGLFDKWFGWMTPKGKKSTEEAGKAEKEQTKTKTEQQTKEKPKTEKGGQK
jgi:hypothetical protein